MKAYWSQGGVMIEPNGKQEIDALMILWNGLAVDVIPQPEFRSGEGSTGPCGAGVHSLDSLVACQ